MYRIEYNIIYIYTLFYYNKERLIHLKGLDLNHKCHMQLLKIPLLIDYYLFEDVAYQ